MQKMKSDKISYCLLRFKADRNATMTILDISLLTGFVVDIEDLKQVSYQC